MARSTSAALFSMACIKEEFMVLSLETDIAGLNARVQLRANGNKPLLFGMIDIEQIGGGGGVEARAHQVALGVLERTGQIHRIADAQEQRTGILWQARG